MVSAAMAAAVGVRADICMIEVPRRTRSVREPHQASGVSASEPYASAVHTESRPSASALATISAAPSGGPADQYPTDSPSFTTSPPCVADPDRTTR